MVLLLWHQFVLLWHQVTMVASQQHWYQILVQFDKTIVLPRKLATGSKDDYLFCYCRPLVGILFEVLKIKVRHTKRIVAHIVRDVYHIESIVSYRYHKTDTGIISKWQINDTFNNTFMIILIRIELLWHKIVFFFFLLNVCFVFHFYIIWKIIGPWIVLYCKLSIPKGQKEKINSLVTFYS